MFCVCVCASLACIAALRSALAGWLSRWGMTICKWAVSLTTMKRLMQLIFHYVPSPQILIISNSACEEQKSVICNSAFRQLQWELLKGFIICSLNGLFAFIWALRWSPVSRSKATGATSVCFSVKKILLGGNNIIHIPSLADSLKNCSMHRSKDVRPFPKEQCVCRSFFLLANRKGQNKFIASA